MVIEQIEIYLSLAINIITIAVVVYNSFTLDNIEEEVEDETTD